MIIRLAALVLLFAASGFGQSFEAASVRPSPPTSSGSPNDPVSFFARRSTLKLLIAQAYDVLIDQVSGGPAWTADDIFDIQARAASPSTQNEKMAMLGALLADRFQLKFHREPGTLRAYALVVAKGGPKFHAAKADDPPPVRTPGTISTRTLKSLASIVAVYLKIPFPATGAPPLSEPEPLPVVDQTGLAGDYDITIDLNHSRDWFVVLEPQLGLKLEPRKVAIDMLIIDSAVKPSAN